MHKIKPLVNSIFPKIKTISDIAERLNVSSETLRKKFLRKEKIHLGDYIMKLKVQLMKEFLLISDKPCYFICFSAGLREDTGAKIFKKFTHMTMQEFREKYKKDYDLLKNDPTQKQRLRLILAEAFDIPLNSKQFQEDSVEQNEKITTQHICPSLAEQKTCLSAVNGSLNGNKCQISIDTKQRQKKHLLIKKL